MQAGRSETDVVGGDDRVTCESQCARYGPPIFPVTVGEHRSAIPTVSVRPRDDRPAAGRRLSGREEDGTGAGRRSAQRSGGGVGDLGAGDRPGIHDDAGSTSTAVTAPGVDATSGVCACAGGEPASTTAAAVVTIATAARWANAPVIASPRRRRRDDALLCATPPILLAGTRSSLGIRRRYHRKLWAQFRFGGCSWGLASIRVCIRVR